MVMNEKKKNYILVLHVECVCSRTILGCVVHYLDVILCDPDHHRVHTVSIAVP